MLPTVAHTTGQRIYKMRSAMLQAWADYLDKLRAGAEVIQLTRAA